MCTRCNDNHIKFSPRNEDQLKNRFVEVATLIYQGKRNPIDLDKELVRLIASELIGGISFLFESNQALAARLASNIYVFSGFKTYQELTEASALLTDEKGVIKPFKTFLNDVQKVHETYNVNYLAAEFETAVAGGQMAEKWESYKEFADVAPFLKYVTAGDDDVREEHAILDGIIRRWDDPFWDKYFPPNGFRCRCDVDQISEGEITALPDDLDEITKQHEMFNYNPGKEQVIFPDTHPYYDVSQSERELIMDKLEEFNNEI